MFCQSYWVPARGGQIQRAATLPRERKHSRSLIGQQEIRLLLEVIQLQLSVSFLSKGVNRWNAVCHHERTRRSGDPVVTIAGLVSLAHEAFGHFGVHHEFVQTILRSVTDSYGFGDWVGSLVHDYRVGVVVVGHDRQLSGTSTQRLLSHYECF